MINLNCGIFFKLYVGYIFEVSSTSVTIFRPKITTFQNDAIHKALQQQNKGCAFTLKSNFKTEGDLYLCLESHMGVSPIGVNKNSDIIKMI